MLCGKLFAFSQLHEGIILLGRFSCRNSLKKLWHLRKTFEHALWTSLGDLGFLEVNLWTFLWSTPFEGAFGGYVASLLNFDFLFNGSTPSCFVHVAIHHWINYYAFCLELVGLVGFLYYFTPNYSISRKTMNILL